MCDLIIQQARLWDGTGHLSVLGRWASRTAISQRAGASFLSCKCCSYGPRWKVRGSYEGGARGNAAPVVAYRRPGLRWLARVCGPHAPETQTARPPMFACDFNGLQRCPTLATSSLIGEPHCAHRMHAD